MNFRGPFLHWIFGSWATATCDRPLEISCCLPCLWFDELARSSWQEDYFYWNNIQQHKRSWRSPDLWDGHSPGSAGKGLNEGTTTQGENYAWGHAKQDLSPKFPPPSTVPLSPRLSIQTSWVHMFNIPLSTGNHGCDSKINFLKANTQENSVKRMSVESTLRRGITKMNQDVTY